MIRKRLLIALMVAGGMVAADVQAADALPGDTVAREEQKSRLTGGVIAEANVSGFFHSGTGGGSSEMGFGGSAGGFLNVGLTRAFSVQCEMLFHYKHSDFEWGMGESGLFRYVGVEIPVYVMYHYRLSGGGCWTIGVGPYTEFGFEATFKHNGVKSDLYGKNEESGLPALCSSNTGFGVKVGYEFACGLQINATYKASVTNLLDANSSTVKMYPHAASVGVAYRFGK